jgi:hypothetical protein
MRKLVIGAAVLSLAMSGNVFAAFTASKCDSGITKAEGKKASCKAGVVSNAQKKGTDPDPAKLTKCEAKFDKSCQKAAGAGDCVVQSATGCTAAEAEVDACVAQFSASPSGAFLN